MTIYRPNKKRGEPGHESIPTRAKEAEETAQTLFDELTHHEVLVNVVALKATLQALALTTRFRPEFIVKTWESADVENKEYVRLIAKRLQLRWESNLDEIGMEAVLQNEEPTHQSKHENTSQTRQGRRNHDI